MRSIIITGIFILSSVLINAQTLSPTALSSGGMAYKASTGEGLSYTIGDLIVVTSKNGSRVLTQGFQQPYPLILSMPDKENQVHINVFPNPTSDVLYISINDKKIESEYVVEVYDIMGKRYTLQTEQVVLSTGRKIILHFNTVAQGQYFVRLVPKNGSEKIYDFRVLKTH